MKKHPSNDSSSAPLSESVQQNEGWRNAFILMRIPYAIFLMPIFWFVLSNCGEIQGWNAFWVFIIIHVFLYPSSIGFNSYFDRDVLKFGEQQDPPAAGQELFQLVMIFDAVAFLSAWFISPTFSVFVLMYTFVSKAYSFNKRYLKRYPILRTIIVSIFLGGYTYAMIVAGIGEGVTETHLIYAGISTLLIAGAYPLSQIYVHDEEIDDDEILPLTMFLGIRGTFIYAAAIFAQGSLALTMAYLFEDRIADLLIAAVCMLPTSVYFLRWMVFAWKDKDRVNHQNAMNMNTIASFSMSMAFLFMVILHHYMPSGA